ncbi:uncharacterized protein RAG0_12352 [Rhynchosporium agropyri]|uniref:Uncharacterized protein n=1 Tax=Rhynchosporium agropyri TaxID=914238 RepID=A0A1E1L8J9_9HELO|nr:uncharacterized protein RAG0_12352 [Rhynchosporium agropyri]
MTIICLQVTIPPGLNVKFYTLTAAKVFTFKSGEQMNIAVEIIVPPLVSQPKSGEIWDL